jgi:hypothetical protein
MLDWHGKVSLNDTFYQIKTNFFRMNLKNNDLGAEEGAKGERHDGPHTGASRGGCQGLPCPRAYGADAGRGGNE